MAGNALLHSSRMHLHAVVIQIQPLPATVSVVLSCTFSIQYPWWEAPVTTTPAQHIWCPTVSAVPRRDSSRRLKASGCFRCITEGFIAPETQGAVSLSWGCGDAGHAATMHPSHSDVAPWVPQLSKV